MVEPRISSIPEGNSDLGQRAVELAHDAGLELDDWQAYVLEASLRKRDDGTWAASEVGINVARQNGKGAIIVARILAELFLVRSSMSIYSAHNFDTAREHFRRLVRLIEDTPKLSKELIGKKGGRPYGITWGAGAEGIALKDDRRFQIRARTHGGGRGFTCDCLFIDEAMYLSEFTYGALEPMISAVPNPQLWYSGSAVDQAIHGEGIVWSRVRERGIAGDPDLAYFEWSAPGERPDAVEDEVLNDPAAWRQANPALGIRIKEATVAREVRRLGPREFAVERLGIGDWPETAQVSATVIDLEVWKSLQDRRSIPLDPVAFAFDVSPNRKSAAIAAAGTRSDERAHVEVVEHRDGVGWLVPRLRELRDEHEPSAIICDRRGPGASVIEELGDMGVKVTAVDAGEYAQACGVFFDLCEQGQLRHLGTPELRSALKGAKTRSLGDAWAWARRQSSVDICPLVAVTLAAWGLRERPSVYEERDIVAAA